jgi:hypothetical protein
MAALVVCPRLANEPERPKALDRLILCLVRIVGFQSDPSKALNQSSAILIEPHRHIEQ